MLPVYDPVVFDLDGTILDSGPTIVKALEEACSRIGLVVPEGTDFNLCVGPPLERILPQVLGSEVDIDAVVASYRGIYRPMAEQETVPMPGAVDLLTEFRSEGLKLAIATYKPLDLALTLLESTGIAHLFDLCGGRLAANDRRTKTAILRDVLERLKPHPRRPLYIGDHEEDRRAAEVLSVDFVAYEDDTSWLGIRRRVFGRSERDDDRSHNDAAAG